MKSETTIGKAVTLCHYGDTLGMENSSEKEYEYPEPLVRLQTLRVTLTSALSWTSHAIYFILFPDNDMTVTTQKCVN